MSNLIIEDLKKKAESSKIQLQETLADYMTTCENFGKVISSEVEDPDNIPTKYQVNGHHRVLLLLIELVGRNYEKVGMALEAQRLIKNEQDERNFVSKFGKKSVSSHSNE